MEQIKTKEISIITETIPEQVRKGVRKSILKFEEEMRKLPGTFDGDSPEYLALCPLVHTFVPGMYIRQISLPKHRIFVTKIHKFEHPYFLLKGDCSVLTEDGPKRIKAPFNGITPAGAKRIIFTHEDTVWITVHITKEVDLKKIEDEVIAKTYQDIGISIDEEAENIKLLEFIDKASKEEDL